MRNWSRLVTLVYMSIQSFWIWAGLPSLLYPESLNMRIHRHPKYVTRSRTLEVFRQSFPVSVSWRLSSISGTCRWCGVEWVWLWCTDNQSPTSQMPYRSLSVMQVILSWLIWCECYRSGAKRPACLVLRITTTILSAGQIKITSRTTWPAQCDREVLFNPASPSHRQYPLQ
jgi:hypothetical protein